MNIAQEQQQYPQREYFVDLSRIRDKEVVDLPLKNIIQERINYASENIVNAINTDAADLFILFGTMAGGKTNTLANVTRSLYKTHTKAYEPRIDNKPKLHVFKLEADNRFTTKLKDVPDGYEPVFFRNEEQTHLEPVFAKNSNAEDITKMILEGEIAPGDIVAACEFPFMGSPQQLTELSQLCSANNIKIVADCLGSWFNTEPLDQVQALMNSQNEERVRAFCFEAYDTTDPHKFAEMTSRFVGIAVDPDTGEILDEIVHYRVENENPDLPIYDANYYMNGRVRDSREVAKLMFERYGDLVFIQDDTTLINNKPHILIPSHPEDELFAIGALRYIPTSIQTNKEMCALAGFENAVVGFTPIQKRYNHPSIVQWPSHLLNAV